MIRVNLAPARERPGTKSLPHVDLRVAFGIAGALLAIAIGGSSWFLFREEARLTVEVTAATREVNVLKAVVGPAVKTRQHLAEMQSRLSVIKGLMKDQSRPLSLIDAFADAIPPDLWITALEDKGAVVRVSGSAFSSTAVSNLMSALRASGKFKDVDIVVSQRDLEKAPNVVTFEITCRFEA